MTLPIVRLHLRRHKRAQGRPSLGLRDLTFIDYPDSEFVRKYAAAFR